MADEVGVDAVAVQVFRAKARRRLGDQVERAGPPAQPRHACGGRCSASHAHVASRSPDVKRMTPPHRWYACIRAWVSHQQPPSSFSPA